MSIIVNENFLFDFVAHARDKRIDCEEEYSDSEDEGEGGRQNHHEYRHHTSKRLKSDMDNEAAKTNGSKSINEGRHSIISVF